MSEDKVLKIIRSTSHKSCDLDPIPTSLVFDCISELLTFITNIVNYSLQKGSFPSSLKTAHVTPLFLKKPVLKKHSQELLTSIQPQLHLQLIEKAVAM